MATTNGPKLNLFKPNDINAKYHEGQETLFYSALTKKTAKGIIKKRYENSCLIDFSASEKLSAGTKEELNSRIVVSYKALKPMPE